MRCCANCFWSISPQLEEFIMEEQGYDKDNPNRTRTGDCCLGMGEQRDKDYCCSLHSYIDGIEENYVLYDDKYMGPGYLLISKVDGEIVKFMKISCYGENGFPVFSIRAFEKDSKDSPNEDFREICFVIKNDDPLYEIIFNLANSLNDKRMYSVDPIFQGKNNLKAKCWRNEAELILSKDIYGVKHATDFIDIFLGDNNTCTNYESILNFYNDLAKRANGTMEEEEVKKIFFIQK